MSDDPAFQPGLYSKEAVIGLVEAILKSAEISSASHLARLAGVAPSTITRTLDRSSDYMPSTRTVEKIAGVLRQLLANANTELEEATAGLTKAYAGASNVRGMIPVVGDVEVGSIKRLRPTKELVSSYLHLSDPDFKGKILVGYQVVGELTDREYKPGTILICAQYPDEPVFAGDVVVRRRRLDTFLGAIYETTLWDVVEEEDGKVSFAARWVNYPDAIDVPERHAGPIARLPGESPAPRLAGEAVLGVVVASYVKRDRNASRLVVTD